MTNPRYVAVEAIICSTGDGTTVYHYVVGVEKAQVTEHLRKGAQQALLVLLESLEPSDVYGVQAVDIGGYVQYHVFYRTMKDD